MYGLSIKLSLEGTMIDIFLLVRLNMLAKLFLKKSFLIFRVKFTIVDPPIIPKIQIMRDIIVNVSILE